MMPLCTLIIALAALAAAAPASADVYPDGTGEPAYTNTLTNTQFIRYEAPQGSDAYRLKAIYYKDNVQVSEVTWTPGPLSGTVWLNWQGVATLQEGSQYAICVTGYFSLPNDSLFFPDGPNSCSTGTNLGRRSYTTIDRTAPTISVSAGGGAAATKSAEISMDIGFQDAGAGPYPANFVCLKAGTAGTCDSYAHSAACSVPKTAGKNTTFGCKLDASALPDGPVTVCAIGTDGSVPDQPSNSNQTGQATSANRSTAQCDTIVLDRAAPTAGIGASKTEALVGEEIAFTSQSSDATTGVDAASAGWQWGDGTADTSGSAAGHKFAAPGTYLVKFRVKDGAGNQGVAEKAITVKAPPAPPAPPKPDPTPPGNDPTPPGNDPTPPGNDPNKPGGDTGGGGGNDKPNTPPDTTAIEKEIAAAAGGGTVFRTQVGSVSVLAPKRFRLGKAKGLVVGVTTEQAGRLTFTLVRGKKTYSRLSVGVAPGITRQKLVLPKSVKPGTHSLKVSFKPSGASWAANGSAKIAFLKAATKKK